MRRLTISKTYGVHTVLQQAALIVNAGERVGLVGANGSGKSTLLKIITGEVEADTGSVLLPPRARIGYLAQAIAGGDDQTLDELIADSTCYLVEMEARLHELEDLMPLAVGAQLDDIMGEYGDISEHFEHSGGYDIAHQTQAVLGGLGIASIARDRLFGTLSGGEKARVALALLLLGAPDVLLLDEPTNHLDFASLTWLEGYLLNYRGAVLIVSHDRQFLNQTVNAIVEIDEHSHTTRRYPGDYDRYQRTRTEERLRWQADFDRQQEEIGTLRLAIKDTTRRNQNYGAHTDRDKFVYHFEKGKHDNTVARRIHAAEEKLRRIEADPIPQPPRPLRFSAEFDPTSLKGRMPLVVSGLSKTFDRHPVLRDVHFTLRLDSRVVIVGPNGAGKSTLLRILAGLEQPDTGDIYINAAVRIGYLDQEQHEADPSQNMFTWYKTGLVGSDQQWKASLLQSGLFRYDDLNLTVGQLSIGQRRKLQIARLIADRANLLLLDEPTNHVSFDVLESLENALQDFPGPVIAVSHDRRFMQQFGGEIWEIRAGGLIQHLGGYNAYLMSLEADQRRSVG